MTHYHPSAALAPVLLGLDENIERRLCKSCGTEVKVGIFFGIEWAHFRCWASDWRGHVVMHRTSMRTRFLRTRPSTVLPEISRRLRRKILASRRCSRLEAIQVLARTYPDLRRGFAVPTVPQSTIEAAGFTPEALFEEVCAVCYDAMEVQGTSARQGSQSASGELMPDLCEWNPEHGVAATERRFDNGTVERAGCSNPAQLIVGAKGKWRLCRRCASLPYFRRYRVRIAIGATAGRND